MNELTQRGIAALKAGDRATARQLLSTAVKQNPNDALAWLWLTGALDNDEERLACLRQVLRIDPANQAAARGLAQIYSHRAAATSQTPPAAPPRIQPEPALTPTVPPAQTPPPVVDTLRAEVTQPLPEAEPAAEVEVEPAVPSPAVTVPSIPEDTAGRSGRGRKAAAAENAPKPIFRTRPSLVTALISFWVFLIGAVILGNLLGGAQMIGLAVAGGLGLILELIVLYVIIRNFTVRYELTNQQLTLRFRGKRARIPITQIYSAECTQSAFQRIIGIGDVRLNAAINGQLANLRMRDIPECEKRTQQIMYLINDQS